MIRVVFNNAVAPAIVNVSQHMISSTNLVTRGTEKNAGNAAGTHVRETPPQHRKSPGPQILDFACEKRGRDSLDEPRRARRAARRRPGNRLA